MAVLKKLALASTGLLAVIASGCNSGGGSVVVAPAWYDVYGNYCGSGNPGPGCNFYSDGYKIVDTEDPYYSQNYFTYDTWFYTDSYGVPASYTGYAWQSPDGVLYNGDGYALNNDGDRDSKDLIADASEAENRVVTLVGQQFAEKYALSEDKGIQIAKTLNDYATLTKKQKRSRTAKDLADFSVRLYGVTADKALTAIDQAKAGSSDGLEALNGEVAYHWGTSPETSKTILKTWYKRQLAEAGIK